MQFQPPPSEANATQLPTLRRELARTSQGIKKVLGIAIDPITPNDALGQVRHRGPTISSR